VKRSAGRPPSVTLAQYQRVLDVKAARAMLPTNKELARELGVPVSTIHGIINRGLKVYRQRRPDGRKSET
jgi:hypothetical protein